MYMFNKHKKSDNHYFIVSLYEETKLNLKGTYAVIYEAKGKGTKQQNKTRI